jgi:anti-sigma factor RsiW
VSCDQVRSLLNAYLDDELALADQKRVTDHLEDCAGCVAAKAAIEETIQLVKSVGVDAPPAGLEGRLVERLGDAAVHDGAQKSWSRWWMTLGGTALASALTAAGLVFALLSPLSQDQLLLRDVTAAHVRSLLQERWVQVEAGDPHRVKPWFAGKLGFAPQLATFAPAGFTLLGGRLDYIEDREVAAIVYKGREHLIDVFVWPSPDTIPPETLARQGYNVVRWHRQGMTVWVISDLNSADLNTFAAALRSAPGG